MSKLNLGKNFSWKDFLKQVVKVTVSIGIIFLFNRYFPEKWIPKDFILKTAVYMCIYILVSLVVELSTGADKGKKKLK